MVYSRAAAPSLRSPSRATGSELKNAEWCRSKKSASPSSTRMPGPPSILSSSTVPSSFQRSSYAMPICVPWARLRLSTRTISIRGASSPRHTRVRIAMITPQGSPARQPLLSGAGCLNYAAYGSAIMGGVGDRNNGMQARLVLVHSPLVGCGTWEPVADVLTGDGYAVSVPDMAGAVAAGPPYHLRQAQVIADCAAGQPAILIGYSRAGPLLGTAGTLLRE